MPLASRLLMPISWVLIMFMVGLLT
jgi:hypothetical protein